MLVSVALLAFSQSGCMTVVATDLRLDGEHTGPYFGTMGQAALIHATWTGSGFYQRPKRWVAGLACLDLPFTVLSDTLFLPVDLTILRPRKKKESIEEEHEHLPGHVR
jgi:uncharacterized protein YceK